MINIVYSLTRYLAAGLLFWGIILCAALNLSAQEGARIYHVTGRDFALTLHGERTFPVDALGRTGIVLEPTGIVHTGPGTLVEIQLLSSGTLIKLAENTSLIYNGLDETGKFEDMGLLYGRIRVVTGNIIVPGAADSIVIRSGGVSARIREGDFGADYLLQPLDPDSVPQPLFNIYAIRGDAEVFPYGMGGSSAHFGGVNILNVNEGEWLSLDISSFHTFAEKKSISREVLVFWNFFRFVGSPPRSMPNTQITVEDAINPITPRPSRLIQLPSSRQKNIFIGIGLSMVAFSVATQAITHPQFDLLSNKELARNIYNMAYVPLGLGLGAILGGVLYNPSGQ